MHTYYNGCHPSISNHDNQSMNTLYYNAGHPTGVEVRLDEDELRAAADLVVRGTVVSDDVVPFRSNPAIPSAARDEPLYREGAYHDVRVRVADRLKGDAPAVVSVRRRDVGARCPAATSCPVRASGRSTRSTSRRAAASGAAATCSSASRACAAAGRATAAAPP